MNNELITKSALNEALLYSTPIAQETSIIKNNNLNEEEFLKDNDLLQTHKDRIKQSKKII